MPKSSEYRLTNSKKLGQQEKDGSHLLENIKPRYFVVRLPAYFVGYVESTGGFQTVVLAKTPNEAFELACESDVWEVLTFLVEDVRVFPKNPR